MENKHVIFGLRLVAFIAISLVVLCFYALWAGKSLEPVSMIVTALVGLLSALAGYFWGSSHSNRGSNNGGGAAVMLLLLATLAVGGCRTYKRSSERVVRDSVAVRVTWKDSSAVRVHLVDKDSTVIVRRDSAVGIAGGSVDLIIDDTAAHAFARRGHVSVRANKRADGSVHVECTADSLTIVITDLESRDVYRLRVIDSLKAVVGRRNDTTVFHHNDFAAKKEEKIPAAPWWLWLAGFALVVLVLFIHKLL